MSMTSGIFRGVDHAQDERRTGVILYLHGGGYTCGSLEYAKGFASTLATECGVRCSAPPTGWPRAPLSRCAGGCDGEL